MVNWRRSLNEIGKTKVHGHWIYDQKLIRDNIEQYYGDLYSEPFPHRPILKGVEWASLDDGTSRDLEKPFSNEEVLAAIDSMEDDKAPGPDGFPTKFLKSCWEVVGKDVMEVFAAFHFKDQWCRSLSATFITLIPKRKEASEIKDYHPISLLGCIYKVLAKTLALRLKEVFSVVIMETQNVFLPGRQITECSLVANELIDARFRKGRAYL